MEWSKFFSQKRTILEKRNIRPIKELGCGTNGCAYLTDTGKVLKMTRHLSEIEVALVIMGNQLPASIFAKVDRVLFFPQEVNVDGTNGVGGILREDVKDFNPPSKEFWDDALFYDLGDLVEEEASLEEIESLFDQMESLKSLAGAEEELFYQFIKDLRRAFRSGYRASDLGVGPNSNIGITLDGRIVIRDFGALEYPKPNLKPEIIRIKEKS